MARTAYVTGGTGCVGRNIISHLITDGWHVIAAVRRSSRAERLAGLPIELKRVDLCDPAEVESSIPMGVDAVFHPAANVSHWQLEAEQQRRDNILATRHLARAALRRGAGRFIFTSTNATSHYAGCTAQQAEKIYCQYVRTKRLAEIELEACAKDGLDVVTLKPLIVIGPYDYNNYAQIFSLVAKGMGFLALPRSIEFVHAGDVARAHLAAFEAGKRGGSYVLGGPAATWFEVNRVIAKVMGVAPPTWQVPEWLVYTAAYGSLWTSYITRRKPTLTPQILRLLAPEDRTPPEEARRAREDLGYVSSSLETMIRDCYVWLLKEGILKAPKQEGGVGSPA